MSEQDEPIAFDTETPAPLTHRRILTVMAIVAILSAIIGFAFVSWQFGLGVLFGGILSFVNYYWLKISLRKIFAPADGGERPRFLGARYAARYLVLGGVLLTIFLMTDKTTVVAVIFGMASFAFAIMIEGFIRLFASFFNE